MHNTISREFAFFHIDGTCSYELKVSVRPIADPCCDKLNLPSSCVCYFVIFSLFRSFTTIYLPTLIQPHLNHIIWLWCASTIAFWPLRYSPKSFTYNKLGGSSLFCLVPTSIDLKLPMSIVRGASRKLRYFRTMFVLVSVYSSTGHFQPDLPAINEISQWRAP